MLFEIVILLDNYLHDQQHIEVVMQMILLYVAEIEFDIQYHLVIFEQIFREHEKVHIEYIFNGEEISDFLLMI